jgi:hypothetical protein
MILFSTLKVCKVLLYYWYILVECPCVATGPLCSRCKDTVLESSSYMLDIQVKTPI